MIGFASPGRIKFTWTRTTGRKCAFSPAATSVQVADATASMMRSGWPPTPSRFLCEAARLAFERSRRHLVAIGLQGGDKCILQRRGIAVLLGRDLVFERLRSFARDFGQDASGDAAGHGRTEDAREGNGGRSRYGALRGDFTLSSDRYRNGIGRTHHGDAVNVADGLRVEFNFADVGAASHSQRGDAKRRGEILLHDTH